MPETETSSPGLLPSLRRLLATAVATVETRAELASVELKEEKARLIITLTVAGAALFCGIMAAIVLTALVVYVWRAYAEFVLAGFGIIYLSAAFMGWRLLHRELEKPILPETFAQLKKDSEWLKPRP